MEKQRQHIHCSSNINFSHSHIYIYTFCSVHWINMTIIIITIIICNRFFFVVVLLLCDISVYNVRVYMVCTYIYIRIQHRSMHWILLLLLSLLLFSLQTHCTHKKKTDKERGIGREWKIGWIHYSCNFVGMPPLGVRHQSGMGHLRIHNAICIILVYTRILFHMDKMKQQLR